MRGCYGTFLSQSKSVRRLPHRAPDIRVCTPCLSKEATVGEPHKPKLTDYLTREAETFEG